MPRHGHAICPRQRGLFASIVASANGVVQHEVLVTWGMRFKKPLPRSTALLLASRTYILRQDRARYVGHELS
jgi:hypothetical protein